jgi:hypothetical protein
MPFASAIVAKLEAQPCTNSHVPTRMLLPCHTLMIVMASTADVHLRDQGSSTYLDLVQRLCEA